MIETERLTLRRWQARDFAPFAALNADPEVRAYFPAVLSRAESDAQVARMEDGWARDGFSMAAAERRADGAFLGMVGLARVGFAPFEGAVEIGWRLGREHWGQGYASEAARAWLGHGFGALGLEEIVAFTAEGNLRSQAVMRRIGMRHDPDRDFGHPALAEGHPIRAHRLFAINAAAWRDGLRGHAAHVGDG